MPTIPSVMICRSLGISTLAIRFVTSKANRVVNEMLTNEKVALPAKMMNQT
jgi:hypothetical protein